MAFDIVAIAASAGGLPAISQILADLPADFPCAIAIVQHLDPTHPSKIVDILQRCTSLTVKLAETGDVLSSRTVYVAPPDYHLLVNPDQTLLLTHSSRVHFVRPSADVLFESVAAVYQERAISVVLSGAGSDGSMGVQAIKTLGGTVIAQDQTTSEFFGMPEAAIDTGCVDFVLPVSEISLKLIGLVGVTPE